MTIFGKRRGNIVDTSPEIMDRMYNMLNFFVGPFSHYRVSVVNVGNVGPEVVRRVKT